MLKTKITYICKCCGESFPYQPMFCNDCGVRFDTTTFEIITEPITVISTREKAMKWWNQLSLEEKFYKIIPWLKSKDMDTTSRHPNSLTGREIEEIYNTV